MTHSAPDSCGSSNNTSNAKYEVVRTAVVFDEEGFHPVWFSLDGKQLKIDHIHYKWKERSVNSIIYKFTVSINDEYYEIHFDTKYLQWKLAR